MNAHEKASLNEAYKAARRLKALEGVSEKHVNAYKAVHKGIRAVLPVPPRNDKKGKVIQEVRGFLLCSFVIARLSFTIA